MGNQQSNERKTNWKIFKIIRTKQQGNFFRLYLNDYVTYEDGNYKYFDISYDENPWTTIITLGNYASMFKEDSYVRIDLNRTKEQCHMHSFEREAIELVEGQVVTDLNGNLVELLSSIGETIGERQRFVAAIEQSRYATNHAWTKQTSWDMPPGWK